MVKGKSLISKQFLRNLAFALILAFSACALAPSITAQAADTSSKKKTTAITDIKDSPYKSEINKIYKYGGLKGLISKKKFQPGKVIRKNELAIILSNLYGDKIKIRNKWLASTKLTQKAATDMLDDVSKQLGHRVTWHGGSKKAQVTREKACGYIVAMIKCQPALDPDTVKKSDNNTPAKNDSNGAVPGKTDACAPPVPPTPPVSQVGCILKPAAA